MSTGIGRELMPTVGEGDFPVLSRDLHQALGVRKKYADWWLSQRACALDDPDDF